MLGWIIVSGIVAVFLLIMFFVLMFRIANTLEDIRDHQRK